MTDLRDQFARLLDNEPEPPYDIDRVVASGQRARRRRTAVVAVAGTAGAAGLTAAVAVPVMTLGGHDDSVSLGARPPAHSATTPPKAHCYLVSGTPKGSKHNLMRLVRSGRVGAEPTVKTIHGGAHAHRVVMEVCSPGTTAGAQAGGADTSTPPAGPPYRYSADPAAIASRLGAHLEKRVNGFGLTITYTRAFAQESSKLDSGHPSYFDGNVDVRESNGSGDIGVQVTHEVTQQVPFTGECTAADNCTETTLPDGSVVRTGQVQAGRGDVVLTAEVHRPDGVVVQAQESNYPFGPGATAQSHGDQPLTLDQLVTLAEDEAFTF